MFETFELSRFLGRPVLLFIFMRQGLTWRFCTGGVDLVIDGHTYVAAQIERSEIKQTAERAKDKIKITMAYLRDPAALEYPPTQDLGDNWFPFVPTSPVKVICLATHYGDTDPPKIEWQGVVTQPKFTDVELELTCEPNSGTDRARNQGFKWQRSCPKTVYSTGPRGCNLPEDAHTISAVVTKVEQANGDVAPQAHVLVPGLLSYLTSLTGTDVRWTDEEGDPHSSEILSAYFAYEWKRIFVGLGVHITTGFSWEDGGSLSDEISHPIQRVYYTKIPALVIANATGLTVGTTIEVTFPASVVEATLTAVNGLVLTAPEFVDSIFSLAGGAISFEADNGLVIRRNIAEHVLGSNTITLMPGGPNPAVGDAVKARPNCARTWEACAARGNTIHYGGAIYKPVDNPIEESMSWG